MSAILVSAMLLVVSNWPGQIRVTIAFSPGRVPGNLSLRISSTLRASPLLIAVTGSVGP